MNLLTAEERKAQPWLSVVANAVASVRFGIVQIVVHDSRVVQIDRTEKLRIDRTEALPQIADGKTGV
jgi:hypothetical protein